MKRTLCLLMLCCSARASTNVPAVIAERWIQAETDTEQLWIDKMSDGTFKESRVKKAPAVIRSRLIATNDVGFAWRFDYEARLSDGTVTTNASFRQKPPNVRLSEKISELTREARAADLLTNRTERLERASKSLKTYPSSALLQAVTVRRRAENLKPVRAERQGGSMVYTYKDGRKETREIRHVVSARKPNPYAPKDIKPPPGNKYGAKELAAFAAGVAAAAAAYGLRRVTA